VSVTKLDHAAEAHQQAMNQAHRLAKSERLSELKGRHLRRFDGQGLHPFSVEVGRLLALRELFPELAEVDLDPVTLRLKAQVDANSEFADELALHGVDEVFSKGLN
jgi:hypothetical protein